MERRRGIKTPAPNVREYICVAASAAFMYQPSIPTTFIMSVFEIEKMITKLATLRDSTPSEVTGAPPDYNQLITRWQTILSKYREHTAIESELFSQES